MKRPITSPDIQYHGPLATVPNWDYSGPVTTNDDEPDETLPKHPPIPPWIPGKDSFSLTLLLMLSRQIKRVGELMAEDMGVWPVEALCPDGVLNPGDWSYADEEF